jgi:hypothetical protein
MSNYLITLKLNYLQSEIDLLKSVNGLTNPLSEDLNGGGHSITDINDILSDGEIASGSIRTTGDIQSLTGTVSGSSVTATGTVSGSSVTSSGNITASHGTVAGLSLSALTEVSTKNILFQRMKDFLQ